MAMPIRQSPFTLLLSFAGYVVNGYRQLYEQQQQQLCWLLSIQELHRFAIERGDKCKMWFVPDWLWQATITNDGLNRTTFGRESFLFACQFILDN